jgi:predicted dehydrogenase
MQWVVNEPIVEVFAYGAKRSFAQYPDVNTLYSVVKFPSGILGRMTATIAACRPHYNPLTVLGEKGTLVNGLLMKTDGPSRLLYSPSKGLPRRNRWLGAAILRSGKVINYPFTHNEHDLACENLIDDFLCSILDDKEPPIPPAESLDAIRVCEAIVQSYQTGKAVAVER